ncbi:hypothetical protein ASD23_16550 [Agromyces sp. Root1464]|uniref:hypothetical protein n=1 Tax=Agromyces sp. Root1464 TaxID=1736467 RepID=UPI0006FAD9FA|nr:hypothetical protein [Agromyces sp. Root1464]KQZ07467.1 hypothetical protein ASD23_16550 [Agromyces sp. Root1464]
MTRTATIVLAGILLSVLTGCAATAEADPTHSPEPVPSAEPSAEPAAAPKPAIALGGSCDALVDEATLSGLVGGDVAPIEAENFGRVWAIAVLGGLDCGWMEQDGDAYVQLEVIPATGLDAQVAAAGAASPECGFGGSDPERMCSFSTEVGGYWFSGIVSVSNAATDTAPGVIEELTSRLEAAAAESAPVPAVLPPGMWIAHDDCAAFGASIDTSAILGMPFTAAEGNRGGPATPGFVGSIEAVGDFPCVWSSADGNRWFATELLPGAGWGVTELSSTEGAESVVVDGAVQAVVLPVDGGGSVVYATDGANLAWVSVPGDVDRTTASALTAAVMDAASR